MAFALTPALVLLVAAELVVRWTGAGDRCTSPFTETSKLWECDPRLHFRTRRDLVIHGEPINTLGFRSPEMGEKREGAYRVVALGDSCTFGLIPLNRGFYVRTPYPRRLQELAAQRPLGRPIEVLNAGVCGYNSFHGVTLLKTTLRNVDADLVTVRYGWNDLLASVGTGPAAYRERTGVPREIESLLLPTALYGLTMRLAMARHAAGATPPVARPVERWTPTVGIDDFKAHLRRIVDLASSAGAETWFLTVPDAFMTAEFALPSARLDVSAAQQLGTFRIAGIQSLAELRDIHAAYNEATRAVGAELGVPVVDIEAVYRANGTRRLALFDASDVMHPLQAGHDLEAEALYAELVARGVARPARAQSIPATPAA